MKLLIWDFDGTLAFRRGMWSAALADVARAHIPECKASAEDFAPHLQSGFPWHHPERTHTHIRSADAWWQQLTPVLAEAVTRATGATRAKALTLAPAIRSCFVDPDHWALYADVLPCLNALSAQGCVHVVLSNHVPELPRLVEALGLGGRFAHVFNSAESGFEKPNPDAFAAVLKKFQSASAIRMIGDSYTADIVGAEAVGLHAILVRKPHANAPEFHESLESLPAALEHVAFR